jgi:hypothetical protein
LAEAESHCSKPSTIFEPRGAAMAARDWRSMKAPVLIVTATLTAAILLAGWLLIITTHDQSARRPAGKISQAAPAPPRAFLNLAPLLAGRGRNSPKANFG